jgi:DNA-binding response OmpR family regulator
MSTLARMSVLVADSDPEAGLLYASFLGLRESQVTQAVDGRDALVMALGAPPSLVITETVLPFIDGYSFCEILRRELVTKSVPILAITADARPASRDRVLSAGADSILVKPRDPDVVRVEVARLNGRSSDLRARAEQLVASAAARRARANAVLERSMEQRRSRKIRSHNRYDTSDPPNTPPTLRCPSCDHSLTYTSSHIGGVTQALAEQWDFYTCPSGCGDFQYRQRTRKLRSVQARAGARSVLDPSSARSTASSRLAPRP